MPVLYRITIDYRAQDRHISANVCRSWFEGQILGANGPVSLRRFPVDHLPVMLPEHSHGVVGFSEPAANATSLLAARR
jgi:hypothetical protein